MRSSSHSPVRRLSALLALLLAALLTSCGGGDSGSAEIPNPPESGNVRDGAEILDAQGMQKINRVIEQSNHRTDAARVAVLTTDQAPGDWEAWTQEVARSWGVGDANRQNGVLLAIDMQERRTRLEVAEGVREQLSDDEAAAILQEITRPALKEERYTDAVVNTVEAVYEEAEGGTSDAASEAQSTQSWRNWVLGIAVTVVGVTLLVVGLWIWMDLRRWRRIADQEIADYQRSHPQEEITEEVRKAYRRYRYHHRKAPAWQQEIDRRRAEARDEGRDSEKADDPAEYTHYAPSFQTWLPLYMMSPTLYSGSGTNPPAAAEHGGGSSGAGSSFGGGTGFSGGGASGSF